ncbi:MAG: hypothetical protein IKW70_00435, partial [Verrucomicrobia bacterium]|nr:hypothetical protein [Verrucomicrobiota bacterium]
DQEYNDVIPPIELTTDVSCFTVEFWDTNEVDWVTYWDNTNSLPLLARVTLGYGYAGNGPAQLDSRVVAMSGSIVDPQIQGTVSAGMTMNNQSGGGLNNRNFNNNGGNGNNQNNGNWGGGRGGYGSGRGGNNGGGRGGNGGGYGGGNGGGYGGGNGGGFGGGGYGGGGRGGNMGGMGGRGGGGGR